MKEITVTLKSSQVAASFNCTTIEAFVNSPGELAEALRAFVRAIGVERNVQVLLLADEPAPAVAGQMAQGVGVNASYKVGRQKPQLFGGALSGGELPGY